MSARRTLALLLACLALPALVACSDDDGDGAKATTSTAASDGKPTASTEPPTTQPQVPFAEGVSQMNANLEAARGDVCKLVSALSAVNVANPSTPDEAREAVKVVVGYLDALADAAPDEAGPLHKAADDFEAEAEAAGYEVSALAESKVMNSDEVGGALTKATQKCSSPAG